MQQEIPEGRKDFAGENGLGNGKGGGQQFYRKESPDYDEDGQKAKGGYSKAQKCMFSLEKEQQEQG